MTRTSQATRQGHSPPGSLFAAGRPTWIAAGTSAQLAILRVNEHEGFATAASQPPNVKTANLVLSACPSGRQRKLLLAGPDLDSVLLGGFHDRLRCCAVLF